MPYGEMGAGVLALTVSPPEPMHPRSGQLRLRGGPPILPVQAAARVSMNRGYMGMQPAQREVNMKFKVLKVVGKGSYGTVYQVQRLSDAKTYALKEMDVRR